MQKLMVSLLAVVVLGGTGWAYAGWTDRIDRATDRPTSTTPTAEPAEPAEPAPTVAFIGDSYTVGAGGDGGGFTEPLSAERDWDIENLGVGGSGYLVNAEQDPAQAQLACAQDYCPSYPEQIEEAAQTDPDIVIVSGGRNNALSSEDDLERAIPAFYEALREALPGAEIWAVSPLWDSEPAPAAIDRIGELVRKSVRAVGGTYYDIGQPLKGRPELVSSDGVHPNDRGYEVIADALAAAL